MLTNGDRIAVDYRGSPEQMSIVSVIWTGRCGIWCHVSNTCDPLSSVLGRGSTPRAIERRVQAAGELRICTRQWWEPVIAD